MRVLALAVVQPAAGGDSNTAIVVAAISAVGLILAALITVIGSRSKDRFDGIERRFDAIEKTQTGLAVALERLERRMEDGFARLAARIDGLYSAGSELTLEELRRRLVQQTSHEARVEEAQVRARVEEEQRRARIAREEGRLPRREGEQPS